MNDLDTKRLDELRALAANPEKQQKFLMESFEVARSLGRHFEDMNGSPQLKRLCNLAADWFAMQAIGTGRPPKPEPMANTVDAVIGATQFPEGQTIPMSEPIPPPPADFVPKPPAAAADKFDDMPASSAARFLDRAVKADNRAPKQAPKSGPPLF